MRFRPGTALVVIACALVVPARAQTATPVLVHVFGEGTVRVRVSTTGGRVGECDDHADATLLDARLAAGRSLWLSSPRRCVCVQHTWGGFREVQWSGARRICPFDRRRWGGGYETFIRVDIPTDRP